MLAIAAEFQGKPEGAASDSRFSGQILRDLIESSTDHGLPLLGLLVHKDNHKALALYERFGFSRLPDLVHGINVAMVRAMS